MREPVTAVRSSNVQLARLPTLRRKRRLLSNEPAHRRAETSRTLLSALGRPPTRATLPASRPIRRLSRTTPGSLGTSPRARVLHACELWLDGRSTVRRSGVWPAIVWDGERVPPFGSLTRRSVQFAVLDRAAGDSAADVAGSKPGLVPGALSPAAEVGRVAGKAVNDDEDLLHLLFPGSPKGRSGWPSVLAVSGGDARAGGGVARPSTGLSLARPSPTVCRV